MHNTQEIKCTRKVREKAKNAPYLKKLLIPLCLLTIILLSGCGNATDKSATLTFTIKDYAEMGAYEPQTESYELHEGESVTPESLCGVTFTVSKITDSSITIKTSEALSVDDIDFDSEETKFKIEKDESIELYTLTMDAGSIYKIYYESNQEDEND